MWVVRAKRRWFQKPVYQLGWLNRSGFGPVDEFLTKTEAETALQRLEGGGS